MQRKGLSIIFNNNYVMFLIILFFFKPIYFQYNSNLMLFENIFVFGKIFVSFLIMFDFIISSYPKIKINSMLINIFLFEIWILIITIIFNGNIFRGFINVVSNVVFSMYIIKSFLKSKNKTVKVFKNCIFTLVLLQLITEILYPYGMFADLYFANQYNALYFVTIDNGTTILVCLCLFLVNLSYMIDFDNNKNKVKLIFQNFLCLLTAYFSHSSTAIICTILMIIFLKLLKSKKNKYFEYGKFWILLYFCITYILVSNNAFINKIFQLLTGKVGFTGRTILWTRAIEIIKNSPIIGYGIGMSDHLNIWGGYYSSHNTILEILLEGGIIALLIWIILILQALKCIKKNQNYIIKRMLLVAILVFLITFLMESNVHSIYFFSIIAIINAFYLEQFKNKESLESSELWRIKN